MINPRISKRRIEFGERCIDIVVHFLSKDVSVTPTLLTKLLPEISRSIPGFFPFLSGIHFHGKSSLDSEFLIKKAFADKTLEIMPCSKPKHWWVPWAKRPPIEQEIVSNIDHGTMD